MSYINKDGRQAYEEEQDLEQAREVREMFNGRKQVYANLDRGHLGEVQGPLELPLNVETINYCDRADEQFQSIDFFPCQSNPPLTFESKISHGGLQRQLIESFNDA